MKKQHKKKFLRLNGFDFFLKKTLDGSLCIFLWIQVDCRTKRRDVTVTVKVQEEGRYALKIFSREPGTKGFDEACVYLIRQRNPSRFSEVRLVLTLSPQKNSSSAKFLFCFNIQSASMSLKVGEIKQLRSG